MLILGFFVGIIIGKISLDYWLSIPDTELEDILRSIDFPPIIKEK